MSLYLVVYHFQNKKSDAILIMEDNLTPTLDERSQIVYEAIKKEFIGLSYEDAQQIIFELMKNIKEKAIIQA